MQVRELIHLCRHFDGRAQAGTPNECGQLADVALKQGEPLLAFDVLKAGRNIWPDDVRLRQLQALALARSGDPGSARCLLERLGEEGHHDSETLGLLARVYKDLADAEVDPIRAEPWLTQAASKYEDAYRTHNTPWSGINAATLSACLGQHDRARELASAVATSRRQELLKAAAEERYWILADLGEASLILGDIGAAADYYAQLLLSAASGRVTSPPRDETPACSVLIWASIWIRSNAGSPSPASSCFPVT